MTAVLGNLGLLGALACSLGVILAAAAGGAADSRPRAARWAVAAISGTLLCYILASLALASALWSVDLRFAYVVSHTSRSLGVLFRLTAFWSGQEGSLLLWALLCAAVAVPVAIQQLRVVDNGGRVTTACLGFVNLFFAGMLLFAASPFRATTAAVEDGLGLHPQLQHWAMAIHPPLTFSGYALAQAPFALMLGAVWSGRAGGVWVRQARGWAIGSWACLTAGIALGAWWAYVELGWGGYWAWDPVENASLMPWLTCTAFLHAALMHERGGRGRALCAALCGVTFVLCLFGTFVTRSGIVQSVHAFANSSVGWLFLVAIGAAVAACVAAAVRGGRSLGASNGEDDTGARDAAMSLGIILACFLAFMTLVGTTLPILSAAFDGTPVSVGARFYDRVFTPLGLAAAGLMAIAPALPSRGGTSFTMRRSVGVSIAGAAILIGVVWALGTHNPGVLAVIFLAALMAAVMLSGLVVALRGCRVHSDVGGVAMIWNVLLANRRRYCGHLAHLGFAVLLIGVAGTACLSASRTASLKEGEAMSVGSLRMRLENVREVQRDTHGALQALVSVWGPDLLERTLRPERRFYSNLEEATAEIALRSTWREDLYIAFVGWDPVQRRVAIEAKINPMVSWIWIGAGTMVCGGVLCAVPRSMPIRGLGPESVRSATRASAGGRYRGTPAFAEWTRR